MRWRWWRQPSPIGELTVLIGESGVRRVVLGADGFDHDGRPERDDDVATELEEYFAGRRRRFTVPVDLTTVAAPFHRAVLTTLQRGVPFGETVSYGELAAMAGRPRAARAAGSACAANPAPILVPCHRVVGSAGIGGYGPAGIGTKRKLLGFEGITAFSRRWRAESARCGLENGPGSRRGGALLLWRL